MKIILYSLYRYYDNNTHTDTAYFKAIFLLLSMVMINLLTILIAFNFISLLDLLTLENKSLRYLLIFCFFALPGYFIISKIVTKKQLDSPSMTIRYKKKTLN